MDEEDDEVDIESLDVFAVEDVCDVGGSPKMPLFTKFAFEDWTMMGLRYELSLLTHAFRRDVNDSDRIGIHIDHLGFYYNKYFKKALNTKFYGVESMKELLGLVRDTVVVNRKNQVVEPQLPEEMESLGILAMLTEEARRDRTRRVDLGDESARLKLSQPSAAAAVQAAAAAGRAAGVHTPVPPGQQPQRPPFQQAAVQAVAAAAAAAGVSQAPPRPAGPGQQWFPAAQGGRPFHGGQGAGAGTGAGYRPMAQWNTQARPYQQAWRSYGR